MQNRWRSKVVWTAITAQVIAILLALGVIDAGQGDTINNVIISVLQLMVVFGVVNDPTNASGL